MRLLSLVLVLLAVGVARADLWSLVQSDSDLSTFAKMVQAADMVKQLQQEGPLTLFAPTNAAFGRSPMNPWRTKFLLDPANNATLRSVVGYHMVMGSVETKSLRDHEQLVTVEGQPLFALVNETGMGDLALVDTLCSEGNFVKENLTASNGVLQYVNTVFIPQNAFCPNTVFWVEQRGEGRVSGAGFNCRSKGGKQVATGQIKGVGLTADSSTQQLFWSDDENSHPFDSWLSVAPFTGAEVNKIFSAQLFDPQGLEADTHAKRLYFTERLGQTVSSSEYDGSDRQLVMQTPTNVFPTDVSVDSEAGVAFVTMSTKGNDTEGMLARVDLGKPGYDVLLKNLNKNFGVCMDKFKKHLFYIQGGNGGGLSCYAYGSTPCETADNVVIMGLEYPYMCAVDNLWAPYGGPTLIAISLANIPGSVVLVQSNGTMVGQVTSGVSSPMGVTFGCVNH